MNYCDYSIIETLWFLKKAAAEGLEVESNFIHRALDLLHFIEIGSEDNLLELSLKMEAQFNYIENIGKLGSTTARLNL